MNCIKTKNYFLTCILIGAAIGIILKFFIFDILHIAGTSMEPAIRDRSIVIVNKLAYGLVKPHSGSFFLQWSEPKRGEIVIFLHSNKIVIKRCIAVSGDRLDFLTDPQYNLIVGDKKITLSEDQYNKMSAFDSVPEGYILAVGDNYAESIDSRTYGFVSVRNVIGRIIGK